MNKLDQGRLIIKYEKMEKIIADILYNWYLREEGCKNDFTDLSEYIVGEISRQQDIVVDTI